jgi:hypothetical protein
MKRISGGLICVHQSGLHGLRSFPAFAPLGLIFASWTIVLGTVVGLNVLWGITVRYRFISVAAARAGVFVVLLKWLVCPAAAIYIWWNGEWGSPVLALFWPVVASLAGAIPPAKIGVVQK